MLEHIQGFNRDCVGQAHRAIEHVDTFKSLFQFSACDAQLGNIHRVDHVDATLDKGGLAPADDLFTETPIQKVSARFMVAVNIGIQQAYFPADPFLRNIG